MVRVRYKVGVTSSMLTDTQNPPAMLMKSAKAQRKGITNMRAATQQVAQSSQVFTQKGEHLQRGLPALEHPLAHALQEGSFEHLMPRIFPFRHRLRQR